MHTRFEKRTAGLCVAGTLFGLLLTGCSHGGSSGATGGPTGASGGGGGKRIEVAFITNNASDYWTIAKAGTEQAKKEMPNVDVDFEIPSDATAAQQKTMVNDMLAKGVQGFAISPVKPDDETQMLNDAAKHTIVFTQDSDAPKSNRACYIGTDNVAAGQQCGEEIKKALPGGGQIMLFVGDRDAQNAHDRETGVRNALKGSNITILDVRTDDTDRVRAKANVSDALVKDPNLAGCVGLWSYNGPAILNAVKDANKIGKVKIVCFDEEPETLAGVKSGAISATIVQQPYEMGHQSIIDLAKVISGDKSFSIPASKQIFIPTQVIDQTTVDAFQTKLHQLTGK